jgi:hypothetical protein
MAKKKEKKKNLKKEKYVKFRKEKPASMTYAPPQLTEEQMQQVKLNEERIGYYMRSRVFYPERFVNERKAKSKR